MVFFVYVLTDLCVVPFQNFWHLQFMINFIPQTSDVNVYFKYCNSKYYLFGKQLFRYKKLMKTVHHFEVKLHH